MKTVKPQIFGHCLDTFGLMWSSFAAGRICHRNGYSNNLKKETNKPKKSIIKLGTSVNAPNRRVVCCHIKSLTCYHVPIVTAKGDAITLDCQRGRNMVKYW